jgi:hypothetical protein
VKDSGQTTLDPQAEPLTELPEMLDLEDEFEETGLDLHPSDDPPGLPGEEHRLEPLQAKSRSTVIQDLLNGPLEWCQSCGARHSKTLCLGELPASEPERYGWRAAVDTPTGRVVHGVLIAPSGDYWRARLMTFPRTLWVVPGGTKALKFIGSDPQDAERQAIAFVEEHCKTVGHAIVDDPALVAEPNPVGLEQSEEVDEAEITRRKLRTVLVRFGPAKPDRRAKTADLSEKGMFIATSEPYARGTNLRLLLEVSGARIPLYGSVQWTRTMAAPGRPAGMGVRLIRPPAFYVQFVRRSP